PLRDPRQRGGALPVDLPALPARLAGDGAGAPVARAPRRRAARRRPDDPDAPPRQPRARRGPARLRGRRQLPPMSDPSRTPPLQLETIRAFGPHRAYAAEVRLDTGVEPDRLVKTHCCFCGQQCGVQLKVKGNTVVGVEPWYDFPFNRGMLCPKGVKRYLQQSHPDRLLRAYAADPAAPGGFRALPYDQAIRRVADAIDRIQGEHGRDAFAVLSGASLTTEKT